MSGSKSKLGKAKTTSSEPPEERRAKNYTSDEDKKGWNADPKINHLPSANSDKTRQTCRSQAETDSTSSPPSPPSTGGSTSTPQQLSLDGSIAIHAGERLDLDVVTDAINALVINPPAYFFKETADINVEGLQVGYEYEQNWNRTTKTAEEKISALEGAESTLLMASGKHVTAVMLKALVPPNAHIVTTTDCYETTRVFKDEIVRSMGLQVIVIDPADVQGLKAALDEKNVKLFFTKSPTYPFLRCVDIKQVSKLCHKKALVCIDGTFATPLNQKALALGADIVVHSATHYIGGHNDVTAGCISGSKELISKVRATHQSLGGTLHSFAAYLIIKSVKTMQLHIRQQNKTAMRMAEFLETHPKVKRVYYPGLRSHPDHELAKRQMTDFGGVVSFEVKGDLDATKRFIDSLKIPYIAPSFGGCESIVELPASMACRDLSEAERLKHGIKDNLVRYSFGIEDFEDLKADILQALQK